MHGPMEGAEQLELNRRDFIGGAVASAATAKFMRGAELAGEGVFMKHDKWMHNGLIDAGGTHEPYLFIVRRGGRRLDARQTNVYAQSEELIRRLSNNGVEVFHTHLYKGFGMEAEWEEMEETRKAVEIAHRMGMKADTYIQWNTMMYETFFAEQPQAVNWIQRDIAGLPILLPYGYQQSFRYRPCFANQEYLNYLKRIVKYAIVEVKTDFIHFDNFDVNAEPDSCHCPMCVSGFRKHLNTKYSPSQLSERFGFKRVDFVNPPQWNKDNPPEKMQIIYDPAFQEWIDFRCQVLADALRQISEYASSLNADVALEINPAGITGGNRPWVAGIDHARLLKFTKAFWSEEGNAPGYHADGQLVSKIRSYKLARAYSNVLLTYVENNQLALAEDLAFNQTLGFVGVDPISEDTEKYIRFFRTYRNSYVDSEDVANVGILRSYASLTYNNAVTQLCAIQAEQCLIQSSILFNLVFDDDLRNLEKYAVLVLPDSECLSDEQITHLRRYVEGGGGLVVIGQTGQYDEWRRVRVVPGLRGLVDNQQPVMDYQESVGASNVKAAPASKKQVGRGRVGYLPAMEFDGPMPAHTSNFEITNEFWKRPKNWQEFIDLVHWAQNGQNPLSVSGPEFVVANCTCQPRKRITFVHLVNYNAAQLPSVKSIGISAALPDRHTATRVTLATPDTKSAQQINFVNASSRTLITVPELQTYALIAIEW